MHNQYILTLSFLSLAYAFLKNSKLTSSFSFNHCITNGANHLKKD